MVKSIFLIGLVLASFSANAAEHRIQVDRAADSKILILSGGSRQEISVQDGDRVVVEVRSAGSPVPTLTSLKKKECKSAYGVTECGYNCVANFGKVVCADHPDKMCLVEGLDSGCGYNCVSHMGKVHCAKTQQGVCKAAYGEVKCVD